MSANSFFLKKGRYLLLRFRIFHITRYVTYVWVRSIASNPKFTVTTIDQRLVKWNKMKWKWCPTLGDPGADSGGEGKSKRAGKCGTEKNKERREKPLGTTSYQTSSKRSPPSWLLIGARIFFSRPFRLSPAPTICPWVSEDDDVPDQRTTGLFTFHLIQHVGSLFRPFRSWGRRVLHSIASCN